MSDIGKLSVTTFSIGEDQYPFELGEHAPVNKGDLNSEFANHAETFAFYATAFELAKEHEARCKAARDHAYAISDHKVRSAMHEAGMKFTEKMVENATITQDAYKDANEQCMMAARNVGLLKAAVDAMNTKRDMLISLGAMMRAEGNSGISLNEKISKVKGLLSVE